MLMIHTATLPVVCIIAINGTNQTVLVSYQLELLHVDFENMLPFLHTLDQTGASTIQVKETSLLPLMNLYMRSM